MIPEEGLNPEHNEQGTQDQTDLEVSLVDEDQEAASPQAQTEKVKFPGEEPDGDEEAISFLEQVIGDVENFESVVDKASLNELALLLEKISERGDISGYINKVGRIKGLFNEKADGENIEKGLLERFSTALARFNKKRTAYYAKREQEKEENSAKKYSLLKRLKVIVQEEQVAKIQEVREIQKEWRETGWVLQKDIQPLKETYKQYLDIFYNLRSKFQELLEVDREYNLKSKEEIIQKIDALIPGEEGTRELWKERSAAVKDLQMEWRFTGPVPKEKIEDINSSFRNVLDRFYEMRSGYYEIQDAQKEENAEKKKVLIEQMRIYSDFKSKQARDWNEATRGVLEIQEKWKAIGPGPIELNKKLWKDYRGMCDTFFEHKSAFFKEFDAIRSENLARKTAICEKAEGLQESEDFRETARVLKELQNEWKSIGPSHERYSNKIWKRFRRACDHFFDRRSKALASEKSEYQENLDKKEKLIEELRALTASEDAATRQDEFNAIQDRWKSTGHVPFRLKDKINNSFKEALGQYFEKTRISGRSGRGAQSNSNYSHKALSSISDTHIRENRIDGEIRKLQTRIRMIKEKVDQYELNIQYISKGKSGDSLRKQIQSQIDGEKSQIKEMKTKVKELRKLRDNPEPEPAPEASAGEEE